MTLIFPWQCLSQMITSFRSYKYIHVHSARNSMDSCQFSTVFLSRNESIPFFSVTQFTMSIYHKNFVCQLNNIVILTLIHTTRLDSVNCSAFALSWLEDLRSLTNILYNRDDIFNVTYMSIQIHCRSAKYYHYVQPTHTNIQSTFKWRIKQL